MRKSSYGNYAIKIVKLGASLTGWQFPA